MSRSFGSIQGWLISDGPTAIHGAERMDRREAHAAFVNGTRGALAHLAVTEDLSDKKRHR